LGFNTPQPSLIQRQRASPTNVGYFRSYLEGLPNNDIEHPFCSCPRKVHETIRHLLTECPLYSRERATMRRESKCPPGRAWIQTVLHTSYGTQALTNFLESPGVLTRWWMLGLDQARGNGQAGDRRGGVEDGEEDEHGDDEE
jgi:hypothetical protein